MSQRQTKENTNRSLEKALRVLLLLGETGQEQGITDLCRATKFPLGTMSRIVATLQKMNFVAQDPSTKKYILGSAIKRLSSFTSEVAIFKNIAHPILCVLRDRTGETSHVYTRKGIYREHVDFAESLQELRTSGRVGDQVPIYAGAASRVLWAFDSEEEIKVLLESLVLAPTTSNTIIDRDKLFNEAKKIRKQGYAVSYGERNPSIGSIAAPVFDPHGKVIGAVSVSLPSVRFDREHVNKLVPDVLWAAKTLGEALQKGLEREGNHAVHMRMVQNASSDSSASQLQSRGVSRSGNN